MLDYTKLAFAFGAPLATGTMKLSPEDFKVDEILGFELTGEGEHLFMLVEKSNLTTEDIVKAIAQQTKYSPKAISYAGLKDRQALTTQWLSLHCPGEDIANVNELSGSGWRILDSTRHLKKLKIGALEGNSFQLILRDIQGIDEVEKRLLQVKQYGVPNYFGLQRFGFGGQNLLKAQRVLFENYKIKDHFLRGMYYSSARSFLFNRILSQRVETQSWNKALSGDVMQLAGTNSVFNLEAVDDLIKQRIEAFDISPAAPLWGRGDERCSGDALANQAIALDGYKKWCVALEQHRLDKAYRSQILRAKNLRWEWQENNVCLEFSLPAGSYATSIVRELIELI